MKVIVDVQKLYDEVEKRGAFDCLAYMRGTLAQIIAGQYPDWATKPTATNKAKLSGGYTEGFEEFWKEYPKKTGKGTAFLEWKKITKTEYSEYNLLIETVEALKWQKTAWAKDNNKYVPMPENYLKGRRWEDEPPAQTKVERYLTPDGVWKER